MTPAENDSTPRPSTYAIILRDGTTLSGSVEEFPKLLCAYIRSQESAPELIARILDLIEFYRKVRAPELFAKEQWLALVQNVQDLEHRARMLIRIGAEFEKDRNYQAACPLYREAVRLEPNDKDVYYLAHNNLGYCLNQLGAFIDGERYGRTAQQIDPTRPNAYKNIGLALQGQARLVDAARAFIAGTLAVPRDPRSLAHLEDLLARHPEIRAELPTIDEDIARCRDAVKLARLQELYRQKPVNPIVGLEIGTTKVIAVVGELCGDGTIVLTGVGEQASRGVRKGEIVDFARAALCVKSVMAMAEELGGAAIREVLLAVSGGHVQGVINRGTMPLTDTDGGVTRNDVACVLELARAINLPQERTVLHTLSNYFYIDDKDRVLNPEGMSGAQLAVDMLVIHAVRNPIHELVQAAHGVTRDVQDVVVSGLCSALSVLDSAEKRRGVIVVDLGGGKTDYVAYAEGVVVAVGTLGLGGDNLTKDISNGFAIPTAPAEQLKRAVGSVNLRESPQSPDVVLPADGEFSGSTVSRERLHAVMRAHMEKLLTMIRRRVEKQLPLQQLGAGIVLTGGGAHIAGVTTLAERVFGLPCRIGKPRNVIGLTAPGPEHATVCGLLRYGFMTMGRSGDDWSDS